VLETATHPRSRFPRFGAFAALATVTAAAVLILTVGPSISFQSPSHPDVPSQAAHRLPPYWIVRPGDSYSEISATTGLTLDQLELLNPNVDPQALSPGQRLQLWQHPPAPPPKPPGPLFWTVRPGDSFGSIAVKAGVNLDTLEQLNPQLKPSTLQPGDRVRLRK
jgi:LysM repeat protein